MLALLSLLAAVGGGLAARRLRLPGGAIVGSLLVSAGVSLTVGDVEVADPVRLALFVGVGTMIGTMVTRPMLREIPAVAVQAVGAAILIIAWGIGVALILRAFDMAPSGDVLATSPGALSVLSAAALENDLDAPTVALFHITRIVLIVMTLPLLVRLLPAGTRAASPAMNPRATNVVPVARPRTTRPSAGQVLQLASTAAAAAVGGMLALRLGIGGALIIGTTVGAATVTLLSPRLYRPPWIGLGVQCGIGWLIGTMVTAEVVLALRAAFGGAVLSAVLLMAGGLAIAWLLRVAGMAPSGDVLATSPGALEALAAIAHEHGAGAVQVSLFHTVRLLLVIASLPLLLTLVR